MAEPIDTMAPWTIKSVSMSTKEAVIKAARQEGLTVGQWLERRVEEWTQAGSPVRQSYPVADVVNLAQAAVALASAPDLPVVKTARISVRAALLSMRGQPVLLTGPDQAAAPPTAPAAPG